MGAMLKNIRGDAFRFWPFWLLSRIMNFNWSIWLPTMSGSNICYFLPKRWRIAVFAIVLLLVAYLVLEPMTKPGSPIDFGCEYEMRDVVVTPESLGVSFCPICFGRNESICEGVLHSTVRLRRKKRASLENKWKPKALGLLNKDRISIKHFGNISEFHKLDNELCSLVGTINAPCGNKVIWKSFVNPSSIERWAMVYQILKTSFLIGVCY